MSYARETVLIAQQLFERLGPGAIGLVESRSDALREAGDIDGAKHWKGVSHAMIVIATQPSAILSLGAPKAKPENMLWSLMQSIEGYRHLASQAEQVISMAGPGAQGLERIAAGWRELAATLESLAGELTEPVPPSDVRERSVYELN
ncbi:MAG: hypothetical protein ACJ798_19750 [Phenylobacterium sp.]|jgi:hypothetical protein